MQSDSWLMANESLLRLSVFFSVLALMMLLETQIPRRKLLLKRSERWPNNLGLVVLNTLLLRLLFPTAAVGAAIYASQQQYGLFNWVQLPNWIAVLLSVIVLDLIIYGQHVLVHKVPILWQVHKVHHADLDYDVTTGSRFHPIEILLSMVFKISAVVVLGAPAIAVILFEIILNGMAMFNHSNIRLPQRLDKYLRKLVVTPDMHRVHHSRLLRESNRNFGFNLSIWDRVFSTYQSQPTAGHDRIQIGLNHYDNPAQVVRLKGLLLLPFRRAPKP